MDKFNRMIIKHSSNITRVTDLEDLSYVIIFKDSTSAIEFGCDLRTVIEQVEIFNPLASPYMRVKFGGGQTTKEMKRER